MATSSLTDALRETLTCFEAGGSPRTTSEVASSLDLGRRSAYDRLSRLVDHGHLETKKVGGNGRVWWQPREDRTAEGEKSDDNAHLKQLVDAVEEYAIFMLDTDGTIQTWNPGAERIKGYEADEIIGEHFSTFYTEDDCEAGVPAENLEKATEKGSIEDEGWRVRADGSHFWANVTITAIRDDDGTLEGFAKVTRDMTDYRENKEELRRQRDYTQQLLETVPTGVVTVEPDGTFTIANERAAELLELGDEDLAVGVKPVYDEDGEFLPPSERPHLRAFETGESVRNWHGQIELSNGSRRWLAHNVEPMLDDSGDVERLLVTLEDITQLKEQARRLERQRDDLEAELEDVFERVDDGFVALDREFRFTYVNSHAAELLDYSETELVDEYIWDVLEPGRDGKAALEGALETALETQEATSFEQFYEGFDSWFDTHVYPSENGLSVYLQDVTGRKEREQALERALDLLHRTEDIADVGGWEIEPETMDIFWSENLFELLELPTRQEPPLEEVLDIYHEEERPIVEEAVERALEDGEGFDVEVRFLTPDGEVRWAHVQGVPQTEGGEVVSLRGAFQDITERKERERALHEAKTQLEAATTAGEIGTWQWHVQDDEFVTDPWFARTFGVDPGTAREGVPVEAFISRIHEQDRDRVSDAIERALDSCGEYEAEYRVRDINGELRWVVARGKVVCDDDGTPLNFPGALTDITERKRAEQELERQREQLATLNSLNETVHEITDAVIEQSTRSEIKEIVCDRLAATESYAFAWIGDVDIVSQSVDVRAEAGVEDYLENVTITVDPEDERGQGPTGRAFQTGEIQTSRDVLHDEQYGPWREQAAEYGFRSSAAIPLVHEETIYGVLNVYAERTDAFEGQERRVISQLGEIVGHAIAAADRKQALMSDEVVELEFLLSDVSDAFNVEEPIEGPLTFDRSVPIDDDSFLQYGTVDVETVDVLRAMVENVPYFEDVTTLGQEDDTVQFELRLSAPPVTSMVAAHGGHIQHAEVEDDEFHLMIHLPPSVSARKIIETVQEAYPQAELRRRRQVTRDDESVEPVYQTVTNELTDRQRTVLEAATYAGFFEWPRESSGEDVAESLGIAPPTFSQHLRKAQGKVFRTLFQHSPG